MKQIKGIFPLKYDPLKNVYPQPNDVVSYRIGGEKCKGRIIEMKNYNEYFGCDFAGSSTFLNTNYTKYSGVVVRIETNRIKTNSTYRTFGGFYVQHCIEDQVPVENIIRVLQRPGFYDED